MKGRRRWEAGGDKKMRKEQTEKENRKREMRINEGNKEMEEKNERQCNIQCTYSG